MFQRGWNHQPDMYSYVICVAASLGSCPQPSLPLLSGVAGPSCGSLGWRCGHWPKVAESPGSAQLNGVKGHSLGSHQEQVLFGSRAAPWSSKDGRCYWESTAMLAISLKVHKWLSVDDDPENTVLINGQPELEDPSFRTNGPNLVDQRWSNHSESNHQLLPKNQAFPNSWCPYPSRLGWSKASRNQQPL